MKRLISFTLFLILLLSVGIVPAFCVTGATTDWSDWGTNSSKQTSTLSPTSTPQPTPTPTQTPTPEASSTLGLTESESMNSSDDENKMFNPKQTNDRYDGLIDGFNTSEAKEALNGIEYDNSLLWAVDGWSRALLITSLSMDLADNDKVMFDKYTTKVSKFYIALIPPLIEGDNRFTYSVMLLDGTDGLAFTYTPASKMCGYKEVKGITQENIDNLSIIAVKIWEVTSEDFSEMSKMSENTINIFSALDETVEQTPKSEDTPQPSPTPTVYSYTRSELEEIAKKCALKELKNMKKVQYGYNDISVDHSKTECYVSYVFNTDQGWIVEGQFVIITYVSMGFTGYFSVTIPNDAPSSQSQCDIDSNLQELGFITPSSSLH